MKPLFKKLTWWIAVLAGVGLLVWTFIPTPVEVDIAQVERAPMQVVVRQEGKTRVKDRYIISAPLAGELQRIELDEGDVVKAGQTVLARIIPSWPALLDARAYEEAEARVNAAEAALDRAGPEIARIEAQLEHSRKQYARRQELITDSAMSQQELEDAELAVKVAEAQLQSARAARRVAMFDLEQARAALRSVTSAATTRPEVFEIHSPIDGVVLRVLEENRRPVAPGTQILELGDVTKLEAEIDVLSRDAVKIRPGAKVYFDRWGGDEPLLGTVRKIEPSGFTKISALGVEEQRVNVIADIVMPEGINPPGDYFRVDARIVIWEEPDVLQVPSGALFRQGAHWAVYVIEDGRAVLRLVELGRMSGASAQVLNGLAEQDQVIVHPSDKVKDGVSVLPRAAN